MTRCTQLPLIVSESGKWNHSGRIATKKMFLPPASRGLCESRASLTARSGARVSVTAMLGASAQKASLHVFRRKTKNITVPSPTVLHGDFIFKYLSSSISPKSSWFSGKSGKGQPSPWSCVFWGYPASAPAARVVRNFPGPQVHASFGY